MGRGIRVIQDADVEKAKLDLQAVGSAGIVANRLQAMISAYKHGVKKVCEVMDVSRDIGWIITYGLNVVTFMVSILFFTRGCGLL
jgi:hypothetical protein